MTTNDKLIAVYDGVEHWYCDLDDLQLVLQEQNWRIEEIDDGMRTFQRCKWPNDFENSYIDLLDEINRIDVDDNLCAAEFAGHFELHPGLNCWHLVEYTN